MPIEVGLLDARIQAELAPEAIGVEFAQAGLLVQCGHMACARRVSASFHERHEQLRHIVPGPVDDAHGIEDDDPCACHHALLPALLGPVGAPSTHARIR